MFDVVNRYLEIVWQHWVNVDGTWTISRISHRTCLKSKFWFVSEAAGLPSLAFVFASVCQTWELDAASFWFESSAAMQVSPHMLSDSSFDWLSPRRSMHSKSVLLFGLHIFETKFNVGLDFYPNYFFSCSFLYPFRHCLRQLAVQKIQILEEMVQLITDFHSWEEQFLSAFHSE